MPDEPVIIPPPREPKEVFAGDSISFTREMSNYPASEWVLTYRLLSQQGSVPITITADDDENVFSIEIESATTADWTPGEYWMLGYVISGTERVQTYADRLTIKPNPATIKNYDGRSYPERMLALLEKVIEEGVIRETISYSYGGASVQVQSMQDAFTVRAWLIAEIKWQQQGKPQQVLTRFF